MRESSSSRNNAHRTARLDHTNRFDWLCLLTFFAIVMVMALPAQAEEDYEAGKRAYLKGDYEEALRIWQPLADGGNKFAQFSLGSLYFEGAGVEKDLPESAKWFRRAAEQGYAPAQFNLGNAYKNGNGVEQDDLKAAEWWRKAAEQEFAPAQFNLGTQYYFGRGVAKDEQTAIRWYRRAAENGHPQAQRLFSMTDTPVSAPPTSAAEAPKSTQTGTAEAVAATSTATSAASAGQSGGSSAAAAGPVAEPSAAKPAAEPSTAEPAAAEPASPEAAAPSATVAAGASPGGESWVLAQNPEDYTLQLLATRSEDLMRTYLEEHHFNQPVAYFAFQREGKQWYAAVYGAYPGKSQAQRAVATLPPEVGKNTPWIRQFGGIQKLISAP